MRDVPNYIPHIYELPPYPDFWMIDNISKERGWQHEEILNMPLVIVYSIADRMEWENKEWQKRYKQK